MFTRLDYLVNEVFRFEYGLRFSPAWWNEYQILYGFLWQLLTFLVSAWNRSKRLFLALEAIVLTATQDLFYCLLWSTRAARTSEWWWYTLHYKIFGTWNFQRQTIIGISTLTVVSLILLKADKRVWRLLYDTFATGERARK
jgi:hypothetical protein